MLFDNFKVHAELRPYLGSIALHFYKRSGGKISLLSGLQFTEYDDTEVREPDDALIITKELAQELMDSLWQCGIRPTEGTGSAGALRATENNLQDLRKISDRLLTMLEKV